MGSSSRSRRISDDGTHVVESAPDGKTLRLRLERDESMEAVPNTVQTPDPLLACRDVLAKAERVAEVEIGGVDGLPARNPGRIRHGTYPRRSDRPRLRVEIAGGATTVYRVVEWLPASRAQLELK